jgi:hypothetical protein
MQKGNSSLDRLSTREIKELDKNMDAFVKSISQKATL